MPKNKSATFTIWCKSFRDLSEAESSERKHSARPEIEFFYKQLIKFTFQVAFGSPAQGVLQRGDIISKVGNYDSRDIRHEDAQNLFRTAGNNIRVVVQRYLSTSSCCLCENAKLLVLGLMVLLGIMSLLVTPSTANKIRLCASTKFVVWANVSKSCIEQTLLTFASNSLV